MKKQQIILIAVVVVIFAGLIYLGVKQSPKEKSVVNNQPTENNALPNNALLNGNNNQSGVIATSTVPDATKPSQSAPLKPSEVPESAIKISITEKGIIPASFAVKAGQEAMLSISSGDQWTHIFKFKSEALNAVAVGIGPKETRAITFIAPKDKGEYEYYCDVPGHTERGEKGVMTVK